MSSDFLQKDIDEATRFLKERPYLSNVEKILVHHIERLKDSLAFNSKNTITHFLFALRHDLKLSGLANRLSARNIKDMATSLALSARTGYLLHIYRPEESDDPVVFELIDMLSVLDLEAVEIVTREFVAPFEKGHPDTVLLCNAIYMALEKHPNPELVVESINSSKSSKFFQSMYRCLLAICETDVTRFHINLKELLKGNRQQGFHSNLEKAICIEAHAMVNLWRIRNPKMQLNFSSIELPLDAEFLSSKPYSPEVGNDRLSEISQVLANWMACLPFDISSDELRSELKEGALKRVTRRIMVAQRQSKFNKARLK